MINKLTRNKNNAWLIFLELEANVANVLVANVGVLVKNRWSVKIVCIRKKCKLNKESAN